MDPRNTCIAGLRLENKDGRVSVSIQQAGRWYTIAGVRAECEPIVMTALQIDRAVSAIDEAAYLAHVGAGAAREGV